MKKLVFGLLATLGVWYLLTRSKWGYEIRLIGDNPSAARYAGIPVSRNIVLVMVLSGGLAGLAGMSEISGVVHRFQGTISPGYGFTAIIVAWLAKLNPFFVIVSSLFFAGILVGGDAIQISLRLPAATVNIVNAVLLLCLIMGDFFLANRLRLARREE